MPYHVLNVHYYCYCSTWFENILRSYCLFWHLICIRFLILDWKPIRHSKTEEPVQLSVTMLFYQRQWTAKTLIGRSFPPSNTFYSYKFVFTKLPPQKLMGPKKIIQCLFPPICFWISRRNIQTVFPKFPQENISLHTHFSPYSMSPKSQWFSLIIV